MARLREPYSLHRVTAQHERIIARTDALNMERFHPASDQVNLGLGGVAIAFQAVSLGFRLALEPTLSPFITHLEPEVTLRVHNHPAPASDLGPPLFGEGKNWILYPWQDRQVLRAHVNGPGPDRPYYTLVTGPDPMQGEIYYEGLAEDPFPGMVPMLANPMDEILLVYLLAQRRGLLVHASAVEVNGNGLLFAGVSGAGKSTLIQQWQDGKEVTRLGDERISLRKQGGQFWLYGTPWKSSAGVASPASAPLKAVFILQHAPENKITPLKPTASIASLLARSFPPFWDADGMAFTLEFLDELVQATPCYELGFAPDARVVDYLRDLIRE